MSLFFHPTLGFLLRLWLMIPFKDAKPVKRAAAWLQNILYPFSRSGTLLHLIRKGICNRLLSTAAE